MIDEYIKTLVALVQPAELLVSRDVSGNYIFYMSYKQERAKVTLPLIDVCRMREDALKANITNKLLFYKNIWLGPLA